MDVQADHVGLESDPHATVAAVRPGRGQGRLFSDSVDTVTSYADTDQLPAIRPTRTGGGGGTRVLRIAVIVVALAVVAAGAALGLVKAGVIGSSSGSGSGSPAKTASHHHTVAAPPAKGPFVIQTATGVDTATYSVPVPAYEVTVTTTTGRSWVSIAAAGQHPVYAGILNPGSSQHETLLGPSEVDIGAGGTSVTITSGKRSTTLKPLAAPFNYQFTTGH
jgi:hypothetical protein